MSARKSLGARLPRKAKRPADEDPESVRESESKAKDVKPEDTTPLTLKLLFDRAYRGRLPVECDPFYIELDFERTPEDDAWDFVVNKPVVVRGYQVKKATVNVTSGQCVFSFLHPAPWDYTVKATMDVDTKIVVTDQ